MSPPLSHSRRVLTSPSIQHHLEFTSEGEYLCVTPSLTLGYVDVFCTRTGERRIHVATDSEHCDVTAFIGRHGHIHVCFGNYADVYGVDGTMIRRVEFQGLPEHAPERCLGIADGSAIAVNSGSELMLFDSLSGKLIGRNKLAASEYLCGASISHGRLEGVLVREGVSGSTRRCVVAALETGEDIASVDMGPDDEPVLSADFRRGVIRRGSTWEFWDWNQRVCERTQRVAGGGEGALQFASKGSKIVWVERGVTVRTWDWATGDVGTSFSLSNVASFCFGHTSDVFAANMLLDGTRARTDFYSLLSGNCLGSAEGHSIYTNGGHAFDPCGAWYASVVNDDAIALGYTCEENGTVVITNVISE